jgi:ubiquinone/menaquinone biosynthesis C-methylase UbiE
VATGSGNVALAAAKAGGSVTGLDLTPELLEAARARAAREGLEVRFEEDSFDVVTSCFGVMFAPRHEVAAGELVRVTRAGGRVVVSAWTPEGLNGRLFALIGSYMPPPPPELKPPIGWGTEEHVRSLFADAADVSFERHMAGFESESTDSWLDYNERMLGPTVLAKAALEPQGRWQPLREELRAMCEAANEADDGTMRIEAEYLVSVITLPG